MQTRTYREIYPELTRLMAFRSSWGWYGLLVGALLAVPVVAPTFVVSYATLILLACVGAIGLNLVTGTTGLISLGHAGFLAVGAYTTAILSADLRWGLLPCILASGSVAAVFSFLVGIPSLRLKGLYLAITTLAFAILVTHAIVEAEWLTRGSSGMAVPRPALFGIAMTSGAAVYYVSLAVTILATLAALNLLRSRVGRAWGAIRDYYIAASLMGIHLAHYKLLAFAVSAFLTGISGSLFALHIRYVNVDNFGLINSIEAIAMIIVGGMGRVRGAILGAIVITLLPDVSRLVFNSIGGPFSGLSGANAQEVKGIIYALMIMLFLRFEPDGLAARWADIKRYWSQWPLSKRGS